jgi:hypothetical protein
VVSTGDIGGDESGQGPIYLSCQLVACCLGYLPQLLTHILPLPLLFPIFYFVAEGADLVDEAHTIKNPKAKMSKACCDLTAQYRWCLTGTPYQNTVDDVYSLVRFLRIPPFSEWSYWRERITSQTKNGKMSLALTRLRTLLRVIMLRRTKDILKVHLSPLAKISRPSIIPAIQTDIFDL